MIRPMRADEFDAFLEHGHRVYIGDMVRAGVDSEAARAKSERDHAALLPQGVETPKHHLYIVEDEGEHAGFLWLAEREADFGPHLFVYGVEIDESRRGRGLGRAAMAFVEDEARRLGISKIALNVFGGNDVARNLYLSMDYRETAIYMEKDV